MSTSVEEGEGRPYEQAALSAAKGKTMTRHGWICPAPGCTRKRPAVEDSFLAAERSLANHLLDDHEGWVRNQ